MTQGRQNAAGSLHSRITSLKRPIVIGIAGDSGSGKTTYSNGIRRLLGADVVQTINMDGYHTENRQQRSTSGRVPLDPGINHLALLAEHLHDIRAGRTVRIPIYNHTTGDFDEPVDFQPSPIVIIEGLHALYSEFLPLLDFTIYVDPAREIKWRWKHERDIKVRGHQWERLQNEMYQREAAYKRWIDFQKTAANVVIKIYPSRMKEFGKYDLLTETPADCFRVMLIMEPAPVALPTLPLPFDLSLLLDIHQPPFLLSAVPSRYWGKSVSVIHLDGVLSLETVQALERHIVDFTAIPLTTVLNEKDAPGFEYERFTATQFAQLLIAWRFLEQVNQQLGSGP